MRNSYAADRLRETTHRLHSETPSFRWTRRTALAFVACLILVGAICSSASAQSGGGPTPLPPPPPPKDPAIVDFSVESMEDGIEYRFRFTGSIINCESLDSPVIVLMGMPFDGTAYADSNGFFSIEFVSSAEEGFGVLVMAHITDNGVIVSNSTNTVT